MASSAPLASSLSTRQPLCLRRCTTACGAPRRRLQIGAVVADQLTAKAAVAKHTRGQQYCPHFEEYITEDIVEKLPIARASESDKVDTAVCFAKLLGITCPSEILQLRIAAVVAIVGLGKPAMDPTSKYVLKGNVRAQIKRYDAASPHPSDHVAMIKGTLVANRGRLLGRM